MKQIAVKILLTIFSISILFHLMVLLGAIPYEMVWGGRLSTFEDMLIFEIISISVNAIFLGVVLIKLRYLKVNASEKVLNMALGLMAFIFLLNTVGNLLSVNYWEKILFTPLTLISSILCLIAIEKKP